MGSTEEEPCDTRLQLGLGLGDHYSDAMPLKDGRSKKKQPPTHLDTRVGLLFCNDGLVAKATVTGVEDRGGENCDTVSGSHGHVNVSNGGGRKKLKLTKDQSSVLENCFKSNKTLNSAQKQALAEQLKLKPRQIEVWFQNRRARTKLKQTEEDYELLKKRCETLGNENRKLRNDLRELRSLIKVEPSDHGLLHTRIPNTMCLSCAEVIGDDESP